MEIAVTAYRVEASMTIDNLKITLIFEHERDETEAVYSLLSVQAPGQGGSHSELRGATLMAMAEKLRDKISYYIGKEKAQENLLQLYALIGKLAVTEHKIMPGFVEFDEDNAPPS